MQINNKLQIMFNVQTDVQASEENTIKCFDIIEITLRIKRGQIRIGNWYQNPGMHRTSQDTSM